MLDGLTLSQLLTVAGSLVFLWTKNYLVAVVYVLLSMGGYLTTELQPLFIIAMVFWILIAKPQNIK